MPRLEALDIGDTADLWRDLGFVVDGNVASIDGVAHVLTSDGSRPGVSAWSVDGTDLGEGVEGLPLRRMPFAAADDPRPPHPNGVIELDHLVISTPDMGRTITTFEELGWPLRRMRDAGRMHQAFFKLGTVILEVVGPPRASGDGPARFYGLAFTVTDLDATAQFFGERLRPAKDAVQKGRRIATLDHGAGSTVAMAFMSAEPRG